jgi:hypothetical protein
MLRTNRRNRNIYRLEALSMVNIKLGDLVKSVHFKCEAKFFCLEILNI